MAGQLKGKEFYIARVKALTEEFPGVVGDAMLQAGASIVEESQRQCPVEHGTLRQSVTITKSEDVSDPAVTIAYGTDYAVYVHERLGLNHPGGGNAKFLENAIILAQPTWANRIWRFTSAQLKARGLK